MKNPQTPREVNDQIKVLELRNFAVNMARNFDAISAEHLRYDCTLEALPRSPADKPVPALVLGSGPSLDDVTPFLASWRGAIFASPTTVANVLVNGLAPSHVVMIDTANEDAHFFQDNLLAHFSTLITHPAVSPETLEGWKGKKAFFRVTKDQLDFNEVEASLYPWMKVAMPSMGCVVNSACNVANFLGYSPIILCGADFGPIGTQSRCNTFRYTGPYRYVREPAPPTKEGEAFEVKWDFEYGSLLCWWKFTGAHLLSLSRGRAKEIPSISIQDAWNMKFPDALSKQAIAERAVPVITRSGMYIGEDGHLIYQGSDEASIPALEAQLAKAKDRASRWYQDVKYVWHYREDEPTD